MSTGRLTRVDGGVVYGAINRSANLPGTVYVEIYVNGLLVGTPQIVMSGTARDGADDEIAFHSVIPQSLIVEAPVSIRAKLAHDERELDGAISLATELEVEAGLYVASGEITISAGTIKGQLRNVNPDAMPIRLEVRNRDAVVARCAVGNQLPAGQDAGRIGTLPFSIPLPITLLDSQVSSVISVRAEGSSRELRGSPLIVKIDAADALAERLDASDVRLASLEQQVAGDRDRMVLDVSDLFYRTLVPRIDALLTTQRESLEGQMIALWRELKGTSVAIRRRAVPSSARIHLDQDVPGHGWSAPTGDREQGRWMGKSGLVLVELSDEHDYVVAIRGRRAVGTSTVSQLSLTVNGHAVPLATRPDPDDWCATAVLPKSILMPHGSVSLVIESPEVGHHPGAADANPVSVNAGTISVDPLPRYPASGVPIASREALAFGWYDVEHLSERHSFRWMQGRASVALAGLGEGEHRVRISGPLSIGDALQHVSIKVNGATAGFRIECAEAGPGWSAEASFTLPDGGPILLELQAPAVTPSATDTRHLSLGVDTVELSGAGATVRLRMG